jgi:Skp family chaperone for outer membrane proteins
MHTKRNLLITAAAFAVLAVGLVGVKAQEAFKGSPTVVAVVDLRTLYESLKEKQQIDAEMETVRTKLTQMRDDKQKEIAQLQQDMDMLVPGTPPYADAQEKYERSALDYQLWAAYEQNKLRRENSVRIEKLTANAEAAIEAVAEAQGVDLVFYKQQSLRLGTNQQGQVQAANINVVAWAKGTVDISDQVAQYMNNAFDNSR